MFRCSLGSIILITALSPYYTMRFLLSPTQMKCTATQIILPILDFDFSFDFGKF